jgi:RNA 2',3'-cyclic 3'-phosphodiesterase
MGLRLFVAVDLGASVRRSMERLQQELRPLAPGARWVSPEKAHLTLAFLGSTEASRVPGLVEALRAAGAEVPPFQLEIEGGGAFGSRQRPHVLWAGVAGDTAALVELHRRTDAGLQPLGYQPEEREYRPHLTLARAADPRGDKGLRRCAEAMEGRSLGAARIDRVILFRSELKRGGAVYTPLAEEALGS